MAATGQQPPERLKLTVHVPPDAGPDDTLALLRTARDNFGLRAITELSAMAQDTYGAGGHHYDATQMGRLAGLLAVNEATKQVVITQLGETVLMVRDDKQIDLIHYLLYTAWQEGGPGSNGPAWTYRTVCNLLWSAEQITISLRQMRDQVEAEVAQQFDPKQYNYDRLSLSDKTVRGVVSWLKKLSPPVISEEKRMLIFRRRTACSRELLLLAIGWVYRDRLGEADAEGRLLGSELLLDSEHRAALCRLCLIEPANLDRLLDGVIGTYPTYIGEGTRAGSFGRFLRLRRLPRLEAGLLL